jgi:glycosyltransferase involved in cell wall biosynthesis
MTDPTRPGPMRILLANKFFRPGAGAETAFFATRRLLMDAGHEVIDFAMASDANLPSPYSRHFAPERSYEAGGSRLRRVRDALASVYSPAARHAIRRLIAEHRPDVAHLHNIYHQLTLSIVDELVEQGVPVVLTLHDYKIVCPGYTLYANGGRCRRCVTGHPFHAVRHRCVKGSRAASALASVETAIARARGSYRKVDAVISPSRFLAEMAATQVPAERIHVIPNFLPVESLPTPLPPADRERSVLFAGRLDEVKGIRPLLDAFLHHDTDGLRLVVAGDGPLRDLVTAAADRSDKVDYVGRIDHDDVQRRLASSVALVLPALWEENNPMIVLEARAAGTPVIVSDGGGLPEMVEDGVDGLLCDARDPAAIARAVRRLAADDRLAHDMAVAGRERFRRENTPSAHYERLMAIYRGVQDGRRAA